MRTEPRLVREGTWGIAFSPDVQLLPTTINDDRTIGQSAARNTQNPDTTIPETGIRHIFHVLTPLLSFSGSV